MPPLPSTFDSEVTELISSIRRREIDIIEVQIPRLKSCSGPLSVQQKLSTELREDLDTLGRQIESIDVMVDDQKGQKNRRELRAVADELKESLVKMRRDYRTAMLASKRTIDMSSMSNRTELLASTEKSRDTRDVNEKVTEDAVMKANNDVTEALQRTLNLMQGELERSVLATQMLESSTATLRATSSTHDVLSNAMDTSKQLITALQKADWIDRLIIFFGLGVFFLVTIFILKQRIFDRSMRLAFWWTQFLPSGKPPISLPVSVASSSLSKSTVASTAAASVTSLVLVAASIVSSSLSPTVWLDSEASTVSILESVVGLDTDTITDSIENPTGSSNDASPLQTEDVHSIDVHDEL